MSIKHKKINHHDYVTSAVHVLECSDVHGFADSWVMIIEGS